MGKNILKNILESNVNFVCLDEQQQQQIGILRVKMKYSQVKNTNDNFFLFDFRYGQFYQIFFIHSSMCSCFN